MSSMFLTNIRRLKMSKDREMVMHIWYYISWAGVLMRQAPTTRWYIERSQ